jgi:prolipoprotein diacylglyceryltransferase
MLLYAISRYVIEIYRGDPRGVVPWLDISTSQFISLVLGPLSLLMLLWLSRTVPTAPQDTRQRRRAAA